ncbi:MAG TPA: hypothetical protein VM925_14285 [Labilithrix sp.]|nr:hypothetical protein [Labilithrix sp.]
MNVSELDIVHCHVDVGGKDRDVERDQAERRSTMHAGDEEADTTEDLEDAAQVV